MSEPPAGVAVDQGWTDRTTQAIAAAAALDVSALAHLPGGSRELQQFVRAVLETMANAANEGRGLSAPEMDRVLGRGRAPGSLPPAVLVRIYRMCSQSLWRDRVKHQHGDPSQPAKLLRTLRAVEAQLVAGIAERSLHDLTNDDLYEQPADAGQVGGGPLMDLLSGPLHGSASAHAPPFVRRGRHAVVASLRVAVDDDIIAGDVLRRIEEAVGSALRDATDLAVSERGRTTMVVIAPGSGPHAITSVTSTVRETLHAAAVRDRVFAGVGRAALGVEGLRTSFEQSVKACEIAALSPLTPRLMSYDQALPYLIVAADPALATSALEIARALDVPGADELPRTLEAYVETQSVQACAARLGVHRHTISARLARIHELTGRSPSEASDAHLLWLAIVATRLFDPSLLAEREG